MIYHKPKTCPGCNVPKTTLSFMIPSAVDDKKKEYRSVCNVCYLMQGWAVADEWTCNKTYLKRHLRINGYLARRPAKRMSKKKGARV